MTPSKIADYFDTMKNGIYGEWSTEAATTIRELEAKLKITTEALEDIAKGDRGEFESGDNMAFDKLMLAAQALARIKGD